MKLRRILWGSGARRLASLILGGQLCLALTADLWASDLPWLLRWRGEVYWLPCLTRPVELSALNNQNLIEQLGPNDWLMAPPIPWHPAQQDKGAVGPEAPSGRHWLGTDPARRDVLAQLVFGARTAVGAGWLTVVIYGTLGVLLGLTAGFFGGVWDRMVGVAIEVILSIPSFFLVLLVVGLIPRPQLWQLLAALSLVLWPRISRLARSEAQRLRQAPFVEAAWLLGLSPARILLGHVLPQAAAPLLVVAAFGLGAATLLEAGLSFLGFGLSGVPSWGALLQTATQHLSAWWLSVPAGLALSLTVVAYHLLGDAIRTELAPQERHVAA